MRTTHTITISIKVSPRVWIEISPLTWYIWPHYFEDRYMGENIPNYTCRGWLCFILRIHKGGDLEGGPHV